MSTYNGKIKVVKARPRSKRLRDIGGTVSTVTSSREVAAAPSVDLSRYMIKETFDELFEKVNLGTAEVPHWAIKAKLNLFTVGWLSFNGPQIGDGSAGDTPVAGAQNLADLKDVSLGSLAAGQALVWNGAKWVNSTIATSGLDEASLSNYLSSHGYATQSWANGAFVNKVGDTMTGQLTIHNGTYNKTLVLSSAGADAKSKGPGILFNGSETGRSQGIVLRHEWYDTFTPGYGLAISRDTSLETGDANMWLYNTGRYISKVPTGTKPIDVVSTTLCTNLNADTVDGVHASSFLYYKGAVLSATTAIAGVGLYGWNTAASSNFNGFGHGYGDSIVFQGHTTWYNRLDFCTNGQIDFWHAINPSSLTGSMSKVGTLAFLHSTVANANSLGGKAAAQYVTTDTAQTITGAKTFTNYTKIEQALMFKAGSDGIYFAPSTDGSLRINTHANYSYIKNIGHITPDGSLTMASFVKTGGTASQFLMADGSVVTKKTATAPCDLGWVNNDTGNSSVPTIAVLAYWDGAYRGSSSNLAYCNRGAFGDIVTQSLSGLDSRYVNATGDTMSGSLWFGAPDKGVRFNHAGVNGIWGHTSDNAATNQIGSTALSNLVIASHWGVAFASTCSNQTYTDKVAVGIDTRIGSVAAGSWVKASHFLANTTTLCTNLNADLLDGLHLDSVRGYRVEHPAINSSLAVGNVPFNAFGMQHGTPLYIDPEFASGTNNVRVYNNLQNGNVTVTRIADNQASANSSGYILQIKVTGAAEPWTGGFVQSIQSRANAVFMQIFRAKIPVGYNVNANSNRMGDNYSDVWITSTAGTGKWEWYARVVYCGASGSFGLGGYVSLKGANATAANPLYWYLSHCQTWDLSKNNYGSLRAKFADALSASRTLWGQSFNGSNNVSGDMTGVGTITSTYYSLHNISNNPYLKFNVGGNITYVQALSTGIGVGPTYTALFVTNDSKVGIGTASPSEKLSIAGWVGTIGASGWCNITYGGGWYMADNVWIRTYNNKNVYAGSAIIRTDGTIQVGNGGSKFYANSSGVVFAATGIWTNGYMSFRGQNTSSDARQKRILRDIHVPLTTIAKAPNVVFSWLDNGKLDMGSIAQYWHEHLPLSVYVRDNGFLGMDYSKVALACVISMASELLGVKDDVSTLKREVRQLRHENRELKQQIDKMERRIA